MIYKNNFYTHIIKKQYIMVFQRSQNKWRNGCENGYDYAQCNARCITINRFAPTRTGSFRIWALPCTYVNESQIVRDFVIKHGYADSIFGLGDEFHEEGLTRYSLPARVRRENGSRNRIMPRQDVRRCAEGRRLARHRKDISHEKRTSGV